MRMQNKQIKRRTSQCKGSVLSWWFVVLLVVSTPADLPAQAHSFLGENDCTPKTVTLNDGPHRIVHFTADANVPLSEPPIRECKFGIEVTDQSGKLISRWGPVLLSAPPIRELKKVHNHDVILIGANQFFLLSIEKGGALKDVAFWQAEKIESSQMQDGDLQIVAYRAYDRYGELPDVFRCDGLVIAPNEPGKKAVFERIVRDSVAYLDSGDKRSVTDWVQGLGVMMELRKACVRVLRAQAVLGDAESAMRLCEKARKEINAVSVVSCSSRAPNCMDGLRDTELGGIDGAMKEVAVEEPYRRLLSQPKVH